MNFQFLELIKYYTSKKSEPIFTFISSDENYTYKPITTVSKPSLGFTHLNENLRALILKNNSTNLGYVGTIDNDLKHDEVTEDKKNEVKKILSYVLPKGISSKISKKQIICIDEEDKVAMNEQFKVYTNRKVKDFENISEFINVFNMLSEKLAYPSSVLLKIVHTISEDKKNLETEIVVTFTNLSK